jgi:dihydropteroate synthase
MLFKLREKSILRLKINVSEKRKRFIGEYLPEEKFKFQKFVIY